MRLKSWIPLTAEIIAIIAVLILCERLCRADKTVFLTTKSGVYQSIVSDSGSPGPWTKLDAIGIAIGTTDGIPNPPPGPIPKPDPPPTPQAVRIRLVIIEPAAERWEATATVIEGLTGWSEFTASGNEYRLYRTNTIEPKGVQAIRDAGSTELPTMLLYDRDTGKLLSVQRLPPTIEGVKAAVAAGTWKAAVKRLRTSGTSVARSTVHAP